MVSDDAFIISDKTNAVNSSISQKQGQTKVCP